MSTIEDEGYHNYVVTTSESGPALYIFVIAYTCFSFLIILPLVVWGRRHEKRRQIQDYEDSCQRNTEESGDLNPRGLIGLQNDGAEEKDGGAHHTAPSQDPASIFRDAPPGIETENIGRPRLRQTRSKRSFGNVLDRLATTGYPDNDPDFMSGMSGSLTPSKQPGVPGSLPNLSAASQIPSAATTSRLHRPTQSSKPRTRVWDVTGRKWKHRRPIGRADVIHDAIHTETQTMGVEVDVRGQRAVPSPAIPSATPSVGKKASAVRGGMSDVASSVLSEGFRDEEDVPRRIAASPGTSRHSRSFSNGSDMSIFRGTVDDISPNDAADADDPGRINSFEEVESVEITFCCGPGALWKPRMLMRAIEGLLELAEPDKEMKRIIGLGVPLTLGAISESLFRAITVCFISHYIGTNAMVAYVIVTRLIGFTDELVGVITDAEGMLCSHALSTNNNFITGQYLQIGTLIHLIINGGILAMWAFNMDAIVDWLVDDETIAKIALDYTRIIVFRHLVLTASRSFSVLYHITGNEYFSLRYDIGEGIATLVVVTCVVALDSDATLQTVGWIQVMIGAAAFCFKLTYGALKGWFNPYLRGLLGNVAFQNFGAVASLLVTSMPLFVGASLEYGEWTLLIVFVAHLGPAEVVTWALLGVVWDILETSTEGVGEAAAIRVAYHLGTGNPEMAKIASYKAVFVSTVESLFVTSILFMLGKNIATWLTTDATLQHLLNDTLTLLGIGNIVLAYTMISWSLIGAQGRYRLSTSVILVSRWLVTTPLAVVSVYALTLQLDGVLAAVIVGYATATTTLAYLLLRSDWERLSRIMLELSAGDAEDESDAESEIENELPKAVNGEATSEVSDNNLVTRRSRVI